MNSDRRKQRQAMRRLKRGVMQNTMILRGWVPVQLNAQYGIYHRDEQRLVMRRWFVPPAPPQSAFPYPSRPRTIVSPPGRWTYQCIQLTAQFEGGEVQWTDIQLRWVHTLRAAAIQRGWL